MAESHKLQTLEEAIIGVSVAKLGVSVTFKSRYEVNRTSWDLKFGPEGGSTRSIGLLFSTGSSRSRSRDIGWKKHEKN